MKLSIKTLGGKRHNEGTMSGQVPPVLELPCGPPETNNETYEDENLLERFPGLNGGD